MKSNPEVKSDREVTVTSHPWPQKTPSKNPGVPKETKLKSSPTQKTPEIYENEDPKIFKKKGNLPEESQPPKHGRISNKEILKINRFPDNYNKNSKPGTKGVSNFQLDQNDLNNNIGRAVHPQRGLPLYEPVKSNPEVAKSENSGSAFSLNGRKFRSTIEAAKFLENFYENRDPKIFKKKENSPEEFQSPKQRKISNEETLKIVRCSDSDNENSKPDTKGMSAATTGPQQDENTNIAGQHPTDLPSLRGSNNTPPNNAVFTNQFSSLFPELTITDPKNVKWLRRAISSGVDPDQVISTFRQMQQLDSVEPLTLTITDPENAKWLRQANSSGIDPDQVISTFLQMQQFEQILKTSSNL